VNTSRVTGSQAKMKNVPISIATVLGTRPEAVKLLPVIRKLSEDRRFSILLAVTGQHREMMREILDPFGIEPHVDLAIMQPGQSLNDIVCRAMPKLDQLFAERSPDLVLVQGDTTSAFCAGLAAFDRRIPVAHVEAGLRSFDRLNPYPEESNRRMLTAIAELHLAPTEHSAENLRREGVLSPSIVVTGNTVIDALLLALREGNAHGAASQDPSLVDGDLARTVLITLHRREAWETPGKNGGTMLDGILAGLRQAAKKHPDVEFIYPVHLNPSVQRAAHAALGNVDNVRLIDPLPYLRFVETMARSSVIVTDSGGVQEEAPSLGVPVLVVRQTTERPEAVRPGMNQLVGTESIDVERELSLLLLRPRAFAQNLPCPSPFGDGHAAARVVQAVLHLMGLGERPPEFRAPYRESSVTRGDQTLGGVPV
jgi:UDP-N-acetylglucosamine 2-epimerase (non-hydrolysing)